MICVKWLFFHRNSLHIFGWNNRFGSLVQFGPMKGWAKYLLNYFLTQLKGKSLFLGVISRMDMKVNPCEDFYQYSCGGWLEKTAIPDSKTRYSTFSELATKNEQIIKLEMSKIINRQVNVTVSIFGCLHASQWKPEFFDEETIEAGVLDTSC